jgi:probable HAF family extracellular repeat protein
MALGLLVAELAFGALPRYEIIDLGTLGGSSSYPSDINDAGQVVGTSRTADGTNGRVHGFLWDEVNGMIDMTELLDESSEWDYIDSAIAINNNGQIVCRTLYEPLGGRSRAISNRYSLWDSETGFVEDIASWTADLVTIAMSEPIHAINDSAEIVGIFSSAYHARLWDSANGITELGTLGGGGSNAFNINEAGEVVGGSSTGFLYENGRDEIHAFLWDRINGMIDLGTLVDRDSSAWAINNFGMAVGASVVEIPDESRGTTINHAFVWTREEGMIDIHDSSYRNSIAFAVNDSDQVVGFVSKDIFSHHLGGAMIFRAGICSPSWGCPQYSSAFLWDRINGMIDLNDILDEDLGWDYLRSAKGINNKGQIIGVGSINGQMHGFLLDPVIPIPADVQVRPETINLSSNGKWIVCLVRLPEDYDVADVDTNSILLEGQIQPTRVWINEKDSVVMLKFSRSEVCDNLEAGKVELTVSGELVDGTRFEGTDTIRTIDKSRLRRFRRRHPRLRNVRSR